MIDGDIPARGLWWLKAVAGEPGWYHIVGSTASTYAGYKPYAGDYGVRALGNLLASETGLATQYALEKAMSRGKLFTTPGDEVYKNQIVGVHSKSTDLVVRATFLKGKMVRVP